MSASLGLPGSRQGGVSTMPCGFLLAPCACSHPWLSSNLPVLCIFHFLQATGPHTGSVSPTLCHQLHFRSSVPSTWINPAYEGLYPLTTRPSAALPELSVQKGYFP